MQEDIVKKAESFAARARERLVLQTTSVDRSCYSDLDHQALIFLFKNPPADVSVSYTVRHGCHDWTLAVKGIDQLTAQVRGVLLESSARKKRIDRLMQLQVEKAAYLLARRGEDLALELGSATLTDDELCLKAIAAAREALLKQVLELNTFATE